MNFTDCSWFVTAFIQNGIKIAQNVSLHAPARENAAAADENFLKFHFPQSAANLSEWPSPAEVCDAISAS